MKSRGERVSTWGKNNSRIYFRVSVCVMISVCSTIHSKGRECLRMAHSQSMLRFSGTCHFFLWNPHYNHTEKTNSILSIVTGKAFVSFYELDIKTLGGIFWLGGTYWFYAEMNKKVPKSEGFLYFNQGWESLTIITSTPHKNSGHSSYRQDCFVFHGYFIVFWALPL